MTGGIALFDDYPGPILGHHPDLLVGLARAAASAAPGEQVQVHCPPVYLESTGSLDGIEVHSVSGRRLPVDVTLTARNLDATCRRARAAGIGVVLNLFFDESHAAVPLDDRGVRFVHVVHRPGELPRTPEMRHRLATLAARDGFVVHTERGRAAMLGLVPTGSVARIPWPAGSRADVMARFAEALAPTHPHVLLVGGARPDKGIDVLLDALATPTGAPPLRIVGEHTAEDDAHLAARTESLDVTWHRRWVDGPAIDDAIRRAAVVVFPYLPEFGLHAGASGALAQATTFAKPLVVSDVLAPDLVSGAGCLVVPAGDPVALRASIDRAVAHAAALHAAAGRAREVVLQAHTFEGHLERMLAVVR